MRYSDGSLIYDQGTIITEDGVYSWTPDVSGTYFIDVNSLNSGFGYYTINASLDVVSVDDYASDTSTTGSLTVGSSVTGNLETYGDSDWFAITLEAGATYQFDQIGPYDAFLYLRDSSGNLITYDDQSGPGAINDAQIIYEATQSGTYYLDATAYADSHTGTYTVAASLISGGGVDDDYAGDTSTTGRLEVGGSVNGELETAGDTDWFAMTLTGGNIYRFEFNSNELTIEDTFVSLYLPDGSYFDLTENGTFENITPNATLYTVYDDFAGFFEIGTVANAIGSYSISLELYGEAPPPPTDDYSADTSTTGSLTVGSSVTGNLETYGDSDWFAITLEAGATYQFDQIGPYDAFLYLRDSSGNVITYDDQSGPGAINDAQIIYTATESGTYYLDATAYADSHTGSYTVAASLISGGGVDDDYASDTSTTGRLEVGSTVTGNLEEYGDSDWFAITLEAGATYQFDQIGPYDAFLYLRDSSGNVITYDDQSGPGAINDAQIIYTATESGTYYLDATAYADSHTGSYTVAASLISDGGVDDDYAGDTSTTGSLTVGSSVNGNLETYGDSDWFAITLEAGATYQFDQIGPYDAFLYLRDSSGNVITYDDQSGPGAINDAQIIYTAAESGTYYLDATAYADSFTGSYTVAASLISGGGVDDDYAGDITTTAFSKCRRNFKWLN